MSEIRAAIIDDEPLARLNIATALNSVSRWKVVAEFNGAEAAIIGLQELQVDVVFLDIKMPGQSGLELASSVQDLQNAPLIVFVTAHDDYALQAFELFAFDYLLKPFNNDRLKVAVDRVEDCFAQSGALASIRNSQLRFRQSRPILDQLVVRSVGSIRIIPIDSINWLRASGNYVEVGHREGMHLQRVPLSYLEKHLDPLIFARIHRSAIVRLSEIREVEPGNDDNGKVRLADLSEHPFSSRYKEALFSRLGL